MESILTCHARKRCERINKITMSYCLICWRVIVDIISNTWTFPAVTSQTFTAVKKMYTQTLSRHSLSRPTKTLNVPPLNPFGLCVSECCGIPVIVHTEEWYSFTLQILLHTLFCINKSKERMSKGWMRVCVPIWRGSVCLAERKRGVTGFFFLF